MPYSRSDTPCFSSYVSIFRCPSEAALSRSCTCERHSERGLTIGNCAIHQHHIHNGGVPFSSQSCVFPMAVYLPALPWPAAPRFSSLPCPALRFLPPALLCPALLPRISHYLPCPAHPHALHCEVCSKCPQRRQPPQEREASPRGPPPVAPAARLDHRVCPAARAMAAPRRLDHHGRGLPLMECPHTQLQAQPPRTRPPLHRHRCRCRH